MSSLDLTKDPEFVPEEVTENIEKSVSVQNAEQSISVDNTETTEISGAAPKPVSSSIDYNTLSTQELVAALKELVDNDINTIKSEVEIIKQVYYKKIKSQTEELKATFIENGGDEIDFLAPKDATEEVFKELQNQYRTKKAAQTAQIEKEKENNLLQKQHILEQMKSFIDMNDDVSAHINEFKALQQKWKTIGQVPIAAANEIWRQFNLYQESFWDLLKINYELREYDFRKNLEAKTAICDAAESLADNSDVVAAFAQLQKLHEEWHELGPVSRELREEMWNRFKDASSVINRKYQNHFEDIRQLEENNSQLKIEICEKIESTDINAFKTFREWDEATRQILLFQEEWRSIGYAPRKINTKLFERYRKACDDFFRAKATFFDNTKEMYLKNAEIKIGLCEKAEALKDSDNWKETTEKMIRLQKEWKNTGPVNKKISDDLWKRFVNACDYFFEQKNKLYVNEQHSAEEENLAKKTAIIEQIAALEQLGDNNEALTKLRALITEWNTIGFVPFKDKDTIFKSFRKAVDKEFKRLNVDSANRRLDNFKTNLKDMTNQGEDKLYKEREKLMKAYEHLKSEIATYENNIGFFSSASKKGGKLIQEMERKIETLREESKLIEQKINLIDQNLA